MMLARAEGTQPGKLTNDHRHGNTGLLGLLRGMRVMAINSPSWYVRGEGNKPAGPFTAEQVIQSLRERQLEPNTICWREAMPRWRPLGQVEPFSSAIRREWRKTQARRLVCYFAVSFACLAFIGAIVVACLYTRWPGRDDGSRGFGSRASVGHATAPATAKAYSFHVPLAEMQVFVVPDRSVRIVYDITFRNDLGAPAIDVVHIRTPTVDCDLEKVEAASGGLTHLETRPSDVLRPGLEIHMGPASIPPCGIGKLHVEFIIPNLVLQDTTRKDYALLRITPSWFGEQHVVGTTDLKVAIHLTKGIRPDEALHQGLNFTQKAVCQGHTVVVWQWPATPLTKAHPVGVSFPNRYMQRVAKVNELTVAAEQIARTSARRDRCGLLRSPPPSALSTNFSAVCSEVRTRPSRPKDDGLWVLGTF